MTCANVVHPVWGKEKWPLVGYRAAVDAQLEFVVGAEPERAPAVEVVRSARRRRTISAERVGDRIVVHIPARMSRAEEAEWVERMVGRVLAGEKRRRRGDGDLLARALVLSGRYLDGRAVPASVRWVDNQQQRWGSCTPADRTVRLSRRLATMPEYVVDYVLLHELAHLIEPGHGPAFAALMATYDKLDRAEGFLDGASHAARAGESAA